MLLNQTSTTTESFNIGLSDVTLFHCTAYPNIYREDIVMHQSKEHCTLSYLYAYTTQPNKLLHCTQGCAVRSSELRQVQSPI